MRVRVDHIGIAVERLDEALAFYAEALGLVVTHVEEVAQDGVLTHFLPAGAVTLELLEATDPDTPVGRFVARRGPGLHHITFEVDDIGEALRRLQARGVRLIDAEPRRGAHGSLVAFVHPAGAHGVLVELKQQGRLDGPNQRGEGEASRDTET